MPWSFDSPTCALFVTASKHHTNNPAIVIGLILLIAALGIGFGLFIRSRGG